MTHWTAARLHAYTAFAILAWAAAIWVALEVALRLAVGYFDGVGQTLAIELCALGALLALRWRRSRVSDAAAPRPDSSALPRYE